MYGIQGSKNLDVKTQFDFVAFTSCSFIAPNMLKNAHFLAYLKKLYYDSFFVKYYEYILSNGIELWKKHGSPGLLTIYDSKIKEEFDELMVNKHHNPEYCDLLTKNTYCSIILMKSNYIRGVKKIEKLLQFVARDEHNAVMINRDMKFFVIVSIYYGRHNKYIVLDSHETVCSELTLNQCVNFVTEKKKYLGGIDYIIYTIEDVYEENGITSSQLLDYMEMCVYNFKNELSFKS